MATRRKLINLVDQAVIEQPVNKAFLSDVMRAIEKNDSEGRRKPSQWYKPSSFVCLRNMYFTRIGETPDPGRTEYTGVGMADTGTRRHVAIQEVLMKMEGMGFDWRYLDVEEYLKRKQAEGKCLDVEVKGKMGAETRLFHKVLKMSFMCDGIIQRISTGEYFLFEFKNQISFKYSGKQAVDDEHIHQVTAYCESLDLEKVFVLYENRDCCELEVPEVLEVTKKMKQELVVDKIMTCESYVERLIPPPKHTDKKPCRWCSYQTACEKAGN